MVRTTKPKDHELRAAGCCWTVGFRGETEYEFKGRTYRVRTSAYDGGFYNGDYYETGILPFVGCISVGSGGNYQQFPPDELCALFPEYVPARYLPDFAGVEYLGEKPAVTTAKWGHVYAVAWVLELVERFGIGKLEDYGLKGDECCRIS
jgi:hypothetical protein